MASTKLPVWANNDLATYSAFSGLPTDIAKSAPKTIDPSKAPKGAEYMPGGNEGDQGTYRIAVPTPAGWDPTVKLYANYDTAGNLTGYSGSNPVFPADASGNLSKVKFTPMWDASGKSASVQDTSHGGYEGTPLLMAGASMIPGVAPFMAAANVANAVINHQPINPSTLISLGVSAIGAMGGTPVDMIPNADGTVTTVYSDGTQAISTPQQGVASPSLNTNLRTASQVAKVAGSLKNPTALVNSLTNLIDVSSDVKVALNATNAIRAIENGMPATAIAPYLSSIIDSSDPQAVSIASKMLNTILPNTTTSPASVNVNTSKTTDTADTTTADTTAPSVNVYTSTNPLAVPTGMTVAQNGVQVNPLAVPNMPVVKPPPATIGKMKELDLQKLFNEVNSLNPVEDNTIEAMQGGSLDDLLRLLNRG
jgi:hypothetical protein